MVAVHDEVAFFVVRPRNWYDVIVQLGESWPMKLVETAGLDEM